jgi:hypothetical protein
VPFFFALLSPASPPTALPRPQNAISDQSAMDMPHLQLVGGKLSVLWIKSKEHPRSLLPKREKRTSCWG